MARPTNASATYRDGGDALVLWCFVLNPHQPHARLKTRRRRERNTNELCGPSHKAVLSSGPAPARQGSADLLVSSLSLSLSHTHTHKHTHSRARARAFSLSLTHFPTTTPTGMAGTRSCPRALRHSARTARTCWCRRLRARPRGRSVCVFVCVFERE